MLWKLWEETFEKRSLSSHPVQKRLNFWERWRFPCGSQVAKTPSPRNPLNYVNVCPFTSLLIFYFRRATSDTEISFNPHLSRKHINTLTVMAAGLNLVHVPCPRLFNAAGNKVVVFKPPLVACSWMSQHVRSPVSTLQPPEMNVLPHSELTPYRLHTASEALFNLCSSLMHKNRVQITLIPWLKAHQ